MSAMTPDIIRTDIRPSGSIPCEYQYLSHDDIIKGALCATGYSTPLTLSGVNLSASVAGDNHFTRASGDFETDGYVAGMWIFTAGFSARTWRIAWATASRAGM